MRRPRSHIHKRAFVKYPRYFFPVLFYRINCGTLCIWQRCATTGSIVRRGRCPREFIASVTMSGYVSLPSGTSAQSAPSSISVTQVRPTPSARGAHDVRGIGQGGSPRRADPLRALAGSTVACRSHGRGRALVRGLARRARARR